MSVMRSVCLSAALALLAAHPLAAQHEAPAPRTGAQLTPSAIRADLAFFRERVLGGDKSYTEESRAAAESRVAKLEAAADTLQRKRTSSSTCGSTAAAT